MRKLNRLVIVIIFLFFGLLGYNLMASIAVGSIMGLILGLISGLSAIIFLILLRKWQWIQREAETQPEEES